MYFQTGLNMGKCNTIGCRAATVVALQLMAFLQSGRCAAVIAFEPSRIARSNIAPPLRIGRPGTGAFGGSLCLSSPKSLWHPGEAIHFEVLFRCDSGSREVYDPFFCLADPDRIQLRVYDADGKLIGTALREVPFNVRQSQLWRVIQLHEIVGRTACIQADTKTIAIDNLAGSKTAEIVALGVGHYSLQFVLLDRFLDYRRGAGFAPRHFARGNTNEHVREQEVCRSNIIDIEISQNENGRNHMHPTKPGMDASASDTWPPCSAKLSVEVVAQNRQGSAFTLLVSNTGNEPVAMFNPFFSELVPIKTADLVLIVGAERTTTVIYETGAHSGSHTIGSRDWVAVPPGGIVGIKKSVTDLHLAHDLAAEVQMIFYDTFISESPLGTIELPTLSKSLPSSSNSQVAKAWKAWRQAHPGKELFRSNTVEIRR